jgi:hypothetical protein
MKLLSVKLLTAVTAFALMQAMPSAAQAGDDDEAAVTPYRPSVSTPAQLPAPGQLEFELGGLSSSSGVARRDSLPYTFKLAFSDEWGILLGGEGFVSARDDGGQRTRGVGDTTVVLKRAFLIDSATAFGLELGAKIPTAKDTIGSGKSDTTVNGIFSRDIGRVHMDLNLNLTHLGLNDPGSGRYQSGAAAAFSTPVSERWGAIAEVSGTHQPGAAGTAQLLLAATYAPDKRLAIDIGVAKGLTAASQDWSVFSGLVVPLAKLW